jgi:hypothetical protein
MTAKQEIRGLIVEAKVRTGEKAQTIVLETVDENTKRPEVLPATTYQLRTPLSDAPFYITISDIVLNQGTEYERRQPFEMFINGKNVTHFQWITAFTRLASAIFRKGGDIKFLIDELQSVYDPNGGYMGRGGRWIPSLVAEIGDIIERHFISIGIMEPKLTESDKHVIEEKKTAFIQEGGSLEDAEICSSCGAKAVIQTGGCSICTNCANSSCG